MEVCAERLVGPTTPVRFLYRPDPGWLGALTERGYDIYCGFDADEAGNEMARQMIHLHPRVKRLSPPGHDWNDVLTSHR